MIKAEPDAEMHTAAVDQRAGAMAAVMHLIELGHRSIVHLSGPLDWYDARAREQGWRDALADATAVFAANDQMALGLVHGLSERGISVPGDISVVGFDDLPDARHFLPPLTTVRQDFTALGALALQIIIAAIEGEDIAEHDIIEPRLIVRGSSAAPRS